MDRHTDEDQEKSPHVDYPLLSFTTFMLGQGKLTNKSQHGRTVLGSVEVYLLNLAQYSQLVSSVSREYVPANYRTVIESRRSWHHSLYFSNM